MKNKVKAKTAVGGEMVDVSKELVELAGMIRADRVTKKQRDELGGSVLRLANDVARLGNRVRRFRPTSV